MPSARSHWALIGTSSPFLSSLRPSPQSTFVLREHQAEVKNNQPALQVVILTQNFGMNMKSCFFYYTNIQHDVQRISHLEFKFVCLNKCEKEFNVNSDFQAILKNSLDN